VTWIHPDNTTAVSFQIPVILKFRGDLPSEVEGVRSRDSSVNTVTKLQAKISEMHTAPPPPAVKKHLFSSPGCPDRAGIHPALYSMGTRTAVFPHGQNGRNVNLNIHFNLVLRLKITGAVSSFIHTPL
jgi:hypothetical protein